MDCPACQAELVHCKNEYGNFWHCGECDGTAVTLGLLRNFVEQDTINALWRGVKGWDHVAKRQCPGCRNRMEEVPIKVSSGQLLIDVCEVCQFVWMDAGEWDALPNRPAESSNLYQGLSPRQKEKLALAQVADIREDFDRDQRDDQILETIGDLIRPGSAQGQSARWLGNLIEGILKTFS